MALARLDPTVKTIPWDKRISQQARQLYRRPYIFSDQEFLRMLETALNLPSPLSPLRPRTVHMMLVLAYCAGLRLGGVHDPSHVAVSDQVDTRAGAAQLVDKVCVPHRCRGATCSHRKQLLVNLVGKIRATTCCSNETAYGLTKSLWASDRAGRARYETIQNNFSLLNRRFEDELAEVCRRTFGVPSRIANVAKG